MARKIAETKRKGKTQTKAQKEKEATTKAKGRKEPVKRKPIAKRKDQDTETPPPVAAENENEEAIDTEDEELIEELEMQETAKENARKQAKRKAKEQRVQLEKENEELKRKMKEMEEANEKKQPAIKVPTNLVKLIATPLNKKNLNDVKAYLELYNHQAKVLKAEPMKVSALLATTDCRDEIIFYLTPHHEKPETFEEWDAVMCIERLTKVVGGGKEGKPTPTEP